MNRSISTLIALLLFITAGAQIQDKFITHYEKNGFNRTPRYDETVEYAKLLSSSSRMVTYTSIGKSPQGRDIPLLIVDKDGLTTPQDIRAKGRSIVLAEASIHAGEPDGKDAGFMLIRDIAIKNQHKHLLDNVSFLFIPIINVDGHEDFGDHYRINQNGPIEVGARTTGQRYNMNRDFIKADAPETRALLALYNKWMPELFIDVHVTNGADFQYVSTYGLDQCGYLSEPLHSWSKNTFESEFNREMLDAGYPQFPYFSFVDYSNTTKGLMADNFAPLYSNGYASANNRIGLLVENHIYKPYKERVTCTYHILLSSLQIIGNHSSALQKVIAQTDNYVSSQAFRRDSLPLIFTHNQKESKLVNYLGWEEITEVSDLSGAKWTVSDYNSPITIQMPMYTSYTPTQLIKMPEAYLIPQEQEATIELLNLHGIQLERLKEDNEYEVETYRFINPKWSPAPYEGRFTINAEYTTQTEKVAYRKGDFVVKTSQPKAKIIAHMLEPKSPTSLVYWGYYNLWIRPASEFFIRLNYMEVKGREMLALDPKLKEEFERRKREDPKFAGNPNAILQFFMSRVRENVEPNANRYPVTRVMNSL